jgi:hypothetical protein
MSIMNEKSTAFSRYRRLVGGFFLAAGYILSPVSWWNDALVNIPLAYLFAWLFSRISPQLFLPAMVAAYWASNVAGLLMMHAGATLLLRKDAISNRLGLWRMVIISTLYTFIMITLVKADILPNPF